MHILQINAVYGIRSTGRTVKELEEYLLENGHKSSVAYSEGIIVDNNYKIGTNFEKKIHGLMSRITGLQGYFSKRGTKKLLKYIKKIKPDIVHVRNLHSNFINMPMLFEFLAENDIATVVTLHDCWFYTGGHTHYVKKKFYDWKNGFLKKNKNRKNITNKSWFFDRSEKIFNDQVNWFTHIPRVAFVGVSKWISEEAKKSKVTEDSLVETIYNWIDTDVFKPLSNKDVKKKLNIQNKFIILGVASEWSTDKGLEKFIELSKHIKPDEHIVLIGKVQNNIYLPDNILNITETHDINELAKYYSMADVFLNLSVEESFGKVTAEALSCGTPVITIDSTANAELVGDGCGYILSKWDVIKTLEKIFSIRKNGKQSYSDVCVNFANQNFNPHDKLNQYLELYVHLTSGNFIEGEKK